MDIERYTNAVNALVRRGGVGEHSVRGALIDELRSVHPNIEAINEPGVTEHGNPDISVYKSAVPIGFVETKALTVDLDVFERTDQFDRYIRGFANLLVTNFTEFRWYLDHERVPFRSAQLGRYGIGVGLEIGDDDEARRVVSIVEAFCSHESRQARSAAELARRLANFAIVVRETVTGILSRQDADAQFRQELDAFRAVLIPNLPEDEFADMYAQTVSYGLFAARCAHPDIENFDRLTAPQLLPVSNPFLRNVFGNLAGVNLDPRVAGLVDQICLLLRTADLAAIIEEFRTRTGLADPVVHFYETFLQTYDRELRKERGVYYTPVSVVSFIVRSVDEALKQELDVVAGLADTTRIRRGDQDIHRVQVLDPATGTGTFLLYLTDFLRSQFANQAGLWNAYVHEELLPRMYGFEYLMAPYAIAHLKVGMALTGQGFVFEQNERLSVYLTNTLEDTTAAVGQLPFRTFLTVEAEQANQIKQERPIMVVLGNPPYSVRTGNLGPNARRLVAQYAEVDGQSIREGGTLALQRSIENDYVKFLAFAQEQVERTGEGVVSYITANGFLDQPTLAGLRRSLMRSFDSIHIVDLHGYARAGTGDENVFTQIGEGVSIIVLVRRVGDHEREAQVRYHSLRGSRSHKRGWLASHHAYDIDYSPVTPTAPDYRFRPENPALRQRYRGEFVGLTEIFGVQRGAIVTARDNFAIGFTQAEVAERLERFRDHRGTSRQASDELGLRWSGDWPNMADQAREWLRQTPNVEQYIQPLTYRPFDDRYIVYSDRFLDTPCSAVMDHVVRGAGQNRLLLFGRTVRYGMPDQFFVTSKLAEAKSAEASRQCHAAPFNLYHDDLAAGSQPNLRPAFIARTEQVWAGALSADDMFGYVYGLLNSNRLRESFADQLCADYARIPLLPLEVAQVVSRLGTRLINLHIGAEQPPLVTGFPVAAQRTMVAEMPRAARWLEAEGGWNFHLNRDQFVSGITDEVRQVRIGGYAVLDKWLSMRQGRTMTVGDIVHLQTIASVLQTSNAVISDIDEVVGPFFD